MAQAFSQREEPGTRGQWFGLLAPPVTWTVHFLTSYLLAETVCFTGVLNFNLLGLPFMPVLIALITLAAALFTGWIARRAYRRWRSLQSRAQASGLQRFSAMASFLLGSFFTLVILLEGYPPLFLWPCW